MTSAAPAILARTERVTRRYGDRLALDGVDLSVAAGEIVGLLGPNGAGKSTLINLLVGIRRPTSGSVQIFGGSPLDPANRRRLGVTPQETGLPPTLRVAEVVDYVSAHFSRRLRSGSGEPGPEVVPRGELLARFGLDKLARRQTGGLSGGERRRLAVALAFVGRPRLVVLDEPTTGLDVEVRHVLWDAIRAFHADGGTVLLSSHYLEEVEALAHRVVVLGNGRVLADDSVAAVRGLVGVHRVSVAAEPVGSLGALRGLSGVVSASESDGRLHLLTPDADELVRTLVHSGMPFRDLEVRPTTLEEAFLHLTARRGELTGVNS